MHRSGLDLGVGSGGLQARLSCRWMSLVGHFLNIFAELAKLGFVTQRGIAFSPSSIAQWARGLD